VPESPGTQNGDRSGRAVAVLVAGEVPRQSR